MEKDKNGFAIIPKGLHWRKIAKMPYLNGVEIEGNEVTTIVGFKEEKMYSQKEKAQEDQLIMFVKNHKQGIILTARKYKELEKLFGGEPAEWVGKPITIFATNEKHFGEFFPVIHIKGATPPAKPILDEKHKNFTKALESLTNGVTTIAAIKEHYKITIATEKKMVDAMKVVDAKIVDPKNEPSKK